MNGNVDDIISKKIDDIVKKNNIYHVGKVVRINSFIVEVTGLEDAFYFERVVVGNENNVGYVDKIDENKVVIALVKTDGSVKVGDSVTATGEALQSSFSKNAMGLIIDPFGHDKISGKKLNQSFKIAIETPKIGIMERTDVNRPLETGLAAIDLMFPIGRGQRQLIIGDKKTGKTQICLDTIVNQKNKDVICIYVSIGKTKKEIMRTYSKLIQKGAGPYTIIVAVFNDDPVPLIKLTPYVALSIAEVYLKEGKDVLVCLDDLKKHADACREIALIGEKNTGRDAYPADIFYTHSRLLEKGCQHQNGGSITILPIVETKGGDITDYISTNIISITDGQIVLSDKSFKKGQKPAVNFGLSVSRLGAAVQKESTKKLGAVVRRELISYLETADVYQLVNMDQMSLELREKILNGQKLLELLNQPKFTPMDEQKLIDTFSFMLEENRPAIRVKKKAEEYVSDEPSDTSNNNTPTNFDVEEETKDTSRLKVDGVEEYHDEVPSTKDAMEKIEGETAEQEEETEEVVEEEIFDDTPSIQVVLDNELTKELYLNMGDGTDIPYVNDEQGFRFDLDKTSELVLNVDEEEPVQEEVNDVETNDDDFVLNLDNTGKIVINTTPDEVVDLDDNEEFVLENDLTHRIVLDKDSLNNQIEDQEEEIDYYLNDDKTKRLIIVDAVNEELDRDYVDRNRDVILNSYNEAELVDIHETEEIIPEEEEETVLEDITNNIEILDLNVEPKVVEKVQEETATEEVIQEEIKEETVPTTTLVDMDVLDTVVDDNYEDNIRTIDVVVPDIPKEKPKKRGFFAWLFGKKDKKVEEPVQPVVDEDLELTSLIEEVVSDPDTVLDTVSIDISGIAPKEEVVEDSNEEINLDENYVDETKDVLEINLDDLNISSDDTIEDIVEEELSNTLEIPVVTEDVTTDEEELMDTQEFEEVIDDELSNTVELEMPVLAKEKVSSIETVDNVLDTVSIDVTDIIENNSVSVPKEDLEDTLVFKMPSYEDDEIIDDLTNVDIDLSDIEDTDNIDDTVKIDLEDTVLDNTVVLETPEAKAIEQTIPEIDDATQIIDEVIDYNEEPVVEETVVSEPEVVEEKQEVIIEEPTQIIDEVIIDEPTQIIDEVVTEDTNSDQFIIEDEEIVDDVEDTVLDVTTQLPVEEEQPFIIETTPQEEIEEVVEENNEVVLQEEDNDLLADSYLSNKVYFNENTYELPKLVSVEEVEPELIDDYVEEFKELYDDTIDDTCDDVGKEPYVGVFDAYQEPLMSKVKNSIQRKPKKTREPVVFVDENVDKDSKTIVNVSNDSLLSQDTFIFDDDTKEISLEEIKGSTKISFDDTQIVFYEAPKKKKSIFNIFKSKEKKQEEINEEDTFIIGKSGNVNFESISEEDSNNKKKNVLFNRLREKRALKESEMKKLTIFDQDADNDNQNKN